jgi:hypothetical protein
MGFARIVFNVSANLTLDPIDAFYPDYSKMAPTTGSATLPVTFSFTLVPGSMSDYVAVIDTNIAGNDPAFDGKSGTATTFTWDGGLGGTAGEVVSGKTYYWGVWQQKTPLMDGGAAWNEESLLFPIVFH